MKKLLAMMALLMAFSAYAEEQSKHMVEFNTESSLLGKFAFQKTKTPGSAASNDTLGTLNLNYAYLFRPQWQFGTRLNYLRSTASTTSSTSTENYGFQIGAIYNFMEDIQNSVYLSYYVGMNWNHDYGRGTSKDELLNSTLALGKRINLKFFDLKNFIYSPEIALTSSNSTTGGSVDYAQNVELRFLQFAVFF